MELRLVALFVAFGLILTACQPSAGEPTVTTADQTTTTLSATSSTAAVSSTTETSEPVHVSDLGRLAYEAIRLIPDSAYHGEELAEETNTLVFFGLGPHGYTVWLGAGEEDSRAGLGEPIEETEAGHVEVSVYEVVDDEDQNYVAVPDMAGVGLEVRVSSHTASVDELIETSARFMESLRLVTES